jgi:hypothetical protein
MNTKIFASLIAMAAAVSAAPAERDITLLTSYDPREYHHPSKLPRDTDAEPPVSLILPAACGSVTVTPGHLAVTLFGQVDLLNCGKDLTITVLETGKTISGTVTNIA